MRKEFTFDELDKHEFITYDLSEQWKDIIGPVEHGFHCLIWGLPGSGKTTFVLRLCGELSKFGNVYYNSAEQGFSGSLKSNARSANLTEEQRRKIRGRNHSFDEMCEAVKKERVKFIVIDSLQYFGSVGITYQQYKKLKAICNKSKKSLIMVSHAVGEVPKGNHAKAIRYDVDVKIPVKQGVAEAQSRYGATKPYIIYDKKKVLKREGLFAIDNQKQA
jgi:predicted ATP-dependent serine protease